MLMHQTDDKYESSNAASQVSILFTLPFISYYTHCGHHYNWHNKNLKNNTGTTGDGMGIN